MEPVPRHLPDAPPHTDLVETAVRFMIGFFGGVFVFLFIPKAIRFALRRLFWGYFGRLVMLATFGFVLDKLTTLLSRDD